MHGTDIFTYMNSWFDGKLVGLSHASVMGRVSCFGISKQKAQKTLSNLSPLWASLPKKWTGLDTYHSRQLLRSWNICTCIYIYIYIPRTWWSTSFLGRLTLHFMGQILQNVGPHLGSRYIHVYIVFFQQDDGFFHVTPSSSVPGPFLSNVSHVWEAQQVKLRKQNQGMKIRKNRWASDQFNLLM